MSYQVIARKYRPQRFAEVIGQEHITRTLQNAVLEGRLHHAYLFTGIRGIGKTTLARIFAKMLNCQKPVKEPLPEPCNECPICKEITAGSSIDVQEIDGASNTGIDDVRELRERVKFLPSSGKYKIYIIDEVHMLSTQAFNGLLKTLEEPPAHVIFIFATTESQKIPATILSRCQRYDFRRIPLAKIMETLKGIARSEGIDVGTDCLEVIATEAEGSMRDAESLFDQAIAYAGKKLTYEHLKELLGFLDRKQIEAAVRAIVNKDADAILKISQELFNGGENLNRFALTLLNRFHDLLVIKTTKALPESAKLFDANVLKELAPKVTIEECQQWFNILYRGAEDIARTKSPKMVLDVLLINMTQVRPVQSIDELLERVERLGQTSLPVEPKAQPSTINHKPSTVDPPPSTSWSSFIEWLKLNKPQVASFLDESLGGNVKDSTLSIRFSHKSFASERLMDADKKAFLEKLASDFFKRGMKIELAFDNGSENVAVEAKKKNHEEAAAKNRMVKEEALAHEIVREAANIVGAEIKEIKVK